MAKKRGFISKIKGALFVLFIFIIVGVVFVLGKDYPKEAQKLDDVATEQLNNLIDKSKDMLNEGLLEKDAE